LGRFNSTNAEDYQLGHGISTTAEVFHRIGNDTLSFAPAIGGYAEWMDHDRVQRRYRYRDRWYHGLQPYRRTRLVEPFLLLCLLPACPAEQRGRTHHPDPHRIVVGPYVQHQQLKTFKMNTKNLGIIATMASPSQRARRMRRHQAPSNSTPTPTTGTVNMAFNLYVGNNVLDMNTLYQDGAGHAIRFTKTKFYVSNVHLTDHDGNVLGHYEDKYILVDAANASNTFTLGTLAPAEVHGAEITLGSWHRM
jgi:hypothetical protein